MITSDVGPWGIVPRALIADMKGDSSAIVVYALLSSYADRKGDDGWTISRKQIAADLGIAVSTAEKALRRLDESGWVEKVPMVSPNGTQGWNRYVVHVTRGVVSEYEGGRTERADPSSLDTTPNQTNETDQVTDQPPRALAVVDTRFDEFWEAYPRKVGKPKAEAAYKKLLGEHDAVMAGLEEWSRYWRARGEPRFIPHPTTWLNRRGWEDEVDPLPGPKVPAGLAALMRSRQRYDERMSHEA